MINRSGHKKRQVRGVNKAVGAFLHGRKAIFTLSFDLPCWDHFDILPRLKLWDSGFKQKQPLYKQVLRLSPMEDAPSIVVHHNLIH